ncbi:MAG: hypothetical protein LCH81_09575 [Bacteroidetes bacterium]|nr:hypothetical protein [Bacteroidota bacterium]
MQNKILLTCFLGLASFSAQTQSINWANDIAPILYDHCTSCHRDGGIGHFSLIGYGNAFSKRYSIQDKTATRQMPPWKPDPSYRKFTHENRLTDAEIQQISNWVDAGAPSGDLAQAPPDPVFSQGSSVGEPDHILTTPFFTVAATEDEYRCFVIPNGLSQAAYLRGLEAIPGNHQMVHHILIYEDTTGQAEVLDSQTPEAGYVNFGGPGVNSARLVGAWVPGAQTVLFPPFMGVKLTPGADLIVQMHYPAGVTGMSDVTTLNFFFTPTNQNIRAVNLAPLLNHSPFSLQNWPLSIPANTVKTYHATFNVPLNGSVVSVAPHMHLIGRNVTSFAITPLGDTIPLIRINDWDFHWQGSYTFQKVLRVPAGSKLHAYATYDNTTDNPFQPNDPPQNVVQGEATTDEMMLVYFAYMAYQTGDENIVLDSTLLATAVPEVPVNQVVREVSVFPNPATDYLNVSYTLAEKTRVHLCIVSAAGQIVQTQDLPEPQAPGTYQRRISIADLPAGAYYLEVQGAHASFTSTPFLKP